MIHYSMYNNYGDRFDPAYDTADPVVTDTIPGDSSNDLIDYLDIHADYVVYFPDLIVTDTAVCIWYSV